MTLNENFSLMFQGIIACGEAQDVVYAVRLDNIGGTGVCKIPGVIR